MTRKRMAMLGVMTFLIGTFLLFPARAAYQWFVPEKVRLSGISGSIWNGKASAGTVAGIYFTNLNWSFKPLSLFVGEFAIDASVNAAGGQISLTAGVGISGNVSMSDLVASLSLSEIHPALRANRIDGMVNIQMESLVLTNGWPAEAEGSIGIGNLIAAAAGPDPLGNFRVDITTEDGNIVGLVTDTGAILDVSGTLRLADDRSYSLVGNVAPNSETPASLNRNLRGLGSPDENGQRQFRLEGAL
jgi:general secretion pathway protein N